MSQSFRPTFPQVFSGETCCARLARRASTILLMCALASLSNPLQVFGSVPATQTFRGTILGTVTDVNGASIPEAAVTARNIATGLERATVTDSAGNYAIPELPVGIYEVTVTKNNFTLAKVINVKVEVAGERRADVAMQVTGGSESVDIRANAVQVESTNNSLGGTISAREVADLPINGRDYTKFLVLVPGATGDPSGATDSPGSFGLFSANGNRGRSNNYLLDGTDMNDGYRNLPAINQGGVFGTPSTILPVDAVEEFPVLSGVEAEYGRNAGAIVNIVTRSGGNTLHGSAFEYFRDDALGSRNFFNQDPAPKNEFRNHQFGGSLGGPIVKDKTFFFVAYEGQRENGGLPGVARVPTAAELA